jgi:uncharacterized membrane protein YbhN (UPF0104 family)
MSRHSHVRRPRSRAIVIAVAAVVVLYLVVPRLVGVEHTWQRIRDGSPVWLVAAISLEAASFVGYIWLLGWSPPRWRGGTR